MNVKMKNKLSARTDNQRNFIRSIVENEIVFALGVAGVGKTYCSVGMACNFLERGKVEQIVLTRPVVNCGSGLGFLPGLLEEKVQPYFQPMYEKLEYFLGEAQLNCLIGENIIIFEPLEVMRGASIENAFVVLDEASNCTMDQLKMFVSRIDNGSIFVGQGDVTQCDLHYNDFELFHNKLQNRDIEGFEFCYLDESDIQRPKILSHILRALNE